MATYKDEEKKELKLISWSKEELLFHVVTGELAVAQSGT
jgi:hypothetical protein